MADDTILSVIGICVAIFAFLLVLLAIGQYFGGSWTPVTVGVAQYIFLITVFGLACYGLFYLLGRH